MTDTNLQVILTGRPAPAVTADLFALQEAPMPVPGPGQCLIKTLYLSLEPAMRGWVAEQASYQEPVPLGAVMTGFTVGEVIASDHPDYAVGDLVMGRQGWQSFAVSDGADIVRKLDPDLAPVETALGPLGINGVTAYVGLVEICAPKAGETVVVTTGAGAVGSVVGQLAKALGCRTVALTGSDDKVAACLEVFGYDAAINYKTVDDLPAALAAATPGGVDCFFDNVGGAQFDAIVDRLNVGGRVAICGTIAMPSFPLPTGPRVNRQLLIKRARMEGFLVLDHLDRFDELADKLAEFYRAGQIDYRVDLADGLAAAPAALVRLLAGENTGKALVRVGAPA